MFPVSTNSFVVYVQFLFQSLILPFKEGIYFGHTEVCPKKGENPPKCFIFIGENDN